jgi:hypothetical protein
VVENKPYMARLSSNEAAISSTPLLPAPTNSNARPVESYDISSQFLSQLSERTSLIA